MWVGRPRLEALAVQVPVGEVERPSLEICELVATVRCQMIALGQVRQHLEALGLKQAVEVLQNFLDSAAS